jgi:DNA (cytosine-5)-methyltransferase 1
MVIKIGTDCSGIEAPIQALQQMGVPFVHSFACDKDLFSLKSIKANYKPNIIYTDITKRNHSLLPDIDIYVCGFPCQPFSLMGNKMGTEDARSNIMYQCIKVIQKKLPKVFILENVKNFKFIEDGKPFNYLISKLQKIKNSKEQTAYNISFDILNTKDYGIPQNRERIFIIGIRKDIQKEGKIYTTPNKTIMKPLDNFIINKEVCLNPNISISLQKNLDKIKINNNNYKKNYIITPFTFYSAMKDVSPTLTFTSCKYMFHSTYKRFLTTKECLLLQGFPKNFINIVGDTHLSNQIGNSMSVNVLKVLFKKIFEIAKI